MEEKTEGGHDDAIGVNMRGKGDECAWNSMGLG